MNALVYFVKSVGHALRGVTRFFRYERNGRIQGIIALLAIALALYFRIQRMEWIIIILCICLVIGLEMMNSALERLCNLYTRDRHPEIKIIKDVAAAAVLLASIGSAVIGVLLFSAYV